MLYLKLNNINVLRLNELMNDRLKRLEGGGGGGGGGNCSSILRPTKCDNSQ